VFNQGSLVDEPYRKFLELSVKLGIYKRWFPHYLQLKLSCHSENVWKPLLWITNAFIYFGGKFCYSLKTMIIMSPFTTLQCIVFFIGDFLQKFDLKNVILTNTKDFSWEKLSKFAKFRKEKNWNHQIFTISSSR
jgi:hypothetical protein